MLPLGELVAELRRDDVRARIVAELADQPAGSSPLELMGASYAFGDNASYFPSPDEALGSQAARLGVHIAEVAYDALLERDGRGMIYVPIFNYLDSDLGAVREMLEHPLTVPGLGDAGAHCTMICDASFPTFLLSFWGYAAPADQRFPVEWIVKRQCADTAALVGLLDRGVLAPGYRADLNLIDPSALMISPPEMLHDLPAGGKRLVQRVRGYRATVVAGEIVYRDGEPTGTLPGTLVRGAQPTPA
jgi:N-acyl-D-aspartate/D-glutamate deacylase